MKEMPSLGFIREFPDPVTHLEKEKSIISNLIYSHIIRTDFYYAKRKYGNSSVFIGLDNSVYVGNNRIKKKCYDWVIKSLLRKKEEMDVGNIFVSISHNEIECIDFLDGPYIKAYNNVGYFARYYSFAFCTDYIKHSEIIEGILDFIIKAKGIQNEDEDNILKASKIGLRLICKFNPIQSLKVIQLYYFYELDRIANIILKNFIHLLKKEYRDFYDNNSIPYIITVVKSLIDLERVRLKSIDSYIGYYFDKKDGIDKMINDFRKQKKL
ncbi:hypothetical protein [Pantoea eucrina]|uniref:hypothetical protein n=1 Tax=Pantoea eucrina TaxID=472693 RepID=UPI003CE74740